METMAEGTGSALCAGLLRCPLVAALLAFSIGAAAAQSLSPEDLKAQIDANLGAKNQYQEILGDPDPRRSREAMKIMIGSGDADLMRMALEFGMTSVDPVAQRMALEGFFNSGPSLQISFDGSSLDDTKALKNDLNQLQGSIDSDKKGYANLRLGPWSEEMACWTWTDGRTCAVRLSDAGSAIFFQGYWYPMNLKDGVLRGVSNMYYTKAPVPFSIPVAQ